MSAECRKKCTQPTSAINFIGDLGEKRTVLLLGRVGWFGEFL